MAMQHEIESTFARNLNAAANATEKNNNAKVSAIERDIANLRRNSSTNLIDRRIPPLVLNPEQTENGASPNEMKLVSNSVGLQRDDDAAIMHGESLPPSPSHARMNISCGNQLVLSQSEQSAESPPSPFFYSAPVSVVHSTCAPTTVDYNYSRQPSAGLSQSQLSSPDSETSASSTPSFLRGLFGCLRPVLNKLGSTRTSRSTTRQPSPSPSLRNNLDRSVCGATRVRVCGCPGNREKQLIELNLQDFIAHTGGSSPRVGQPETSTCNHGVSGRRDGSITGSRNGSISGKGAGSPRGSTTQIRCRNGSEIAIDEAADEDCLIRFDELSELKFFAAGAQGAVFRGEYRGRLVAFKKVRDAADAENMRFLRAMSHPNVIELLGVVLEHEPPNSQVPPCYGIVMAFCEFGSLYNLLHDGRPVLPATCLRWLSEIAEGMRYLHVYRIIHRDLKSPNILITADETVKISDFGASRTWSAASTKLTFAGTAAWVAPELIRHEKCTDRVDVWSYGIVVWEVLTGEVPYRDLDQPAIIYGVGSKRLSLPIPAVGFPSGFHMLINTCCNDDPRARPSFRQVSERLMVVGHELANLSVDHFEASKQRWREEIKRELAARYARNGNDKATTDRRLERELIARREAELRHATELKLLYEAKLRRGTQLYEDLCRLVTDHETALTRLRLLQAHYRATASVRLGTAAGDGAGANFPPPRKSRVSSARHKSVADVTSVSDLGYSGRKRSAPTRNAAGTASSQSCVCLSVPQAQTAGNPSSSTSSSDTANVQSSYYVTDIDIDENWQNSHANPPMMRTEASSSDECFETHRDCSKGGNGDCVMCAVAQLLGSLDTSAHDSNVIQKLAQLCAAPHPHAHAHANAHRGANASISHAHSAIQLLRGDNVSLGARPNVNASASDLRSRSIVKQSRPTRLHPRTISPASVAYAERVDHSDARARLNVTSGGGEQRVSMVETATPISSVRSSTLSEAISTSAVSMQSLNDSASIGASSSATITALRTNSQNDLNVSNRNQATTSLAVAATSSYANRFSLSVTAAAAMNSDEVRPSSSAHDVNASIPIQNGSIVHLRRSNRRVIVADDASSGSTVVFRNMSISFSTSPTDDTLASPTISLGAASCPVGEDDGARLPCDYRDEPTRDSRISYITNEDDRCQRDSRFSNAHADVEDNADADSEAGLSDLGEFDYASLNEVDAGTETDGDDASDESRLSRSGKLRTSGRSCASIVTLVNTTTPVAPTSGKPSSRIGSVSKRVKAVVPDSLKLASVDLDSNGATRVPQSTSRDSAIVLGVTPGTPTPLSHGTEPPAELINLLASNSNCMTLSVIDETRSSTASVSNESRPVSAISDSSSCCSVSGRVGKADFVQRELERQISDNLSDKELVVQTLRSRLERSAAAASSETHADSVITQHSRSRENVANLRPLAQRTAATLPARLPLNIAAGNTPLSSCSGEAFSSSDDMDVAQIGTSRHASRSRVLPVATPEARASLETASARVY